jgi:hypothetical protein
LARAVGPGGTVYYTDNDPENARRRPQPRAHPGGRRARIAAVHERPVRPDLQRRG